MQKTTLKKAVKGSTTNRNLWNFIIHKNKVTADEKQLTKLFNSYYISVEKNSAIKAKTLNINFENTSMQPVSDIANFYKNCRSTVKVKQVVNGSDVCDSERFSLKTVNETEIKNFLRILDIKKESDVDKIPSNLVKVSANVLFLLLTKAINTSIKQNVFPENTKSTSVISLDKGKPKNNEISHFRPVKVPNTFAKIYDRVMKDKIICDMEKYFLPFLSAQR